MAGYLLNTVVYSIFFTTIHLLKTFVIHWCGSLSQCNRSIWNANSKCSMQVFCVKQSRPTVEQLSSFSLLSAGLLAPPLKVSHAPHLMSAAHAINPLSSLLFNTDLLKSC